MDTRSIEFENKFVVDVGVHSVFHISAGPFDSLEEAMSRFQEMAPTGAQLRVRGAGNKVYAEGHKGEIFLHDPPRTFRQNA